MIEENVFFKLLTHLVGLEPMTSPSTLLFQGEEVPFELELIGLFCILEQSKEYM